MDFDFFWKSHRLEHFWSEHARVSNLNPFIQIWVEGEDLERRLGIGIIGGFETKVR